MKNRIRELRTRKNLTQADLADAVGVRRETIVFLEKGTYNPSLKLAHNVAVVLGTTVDELFLFEEEKEEAEEEGIDLVLEE
jgi:putative transcriptional regulator